METTAYYAFGVPIYVGLVVAEWIVARRRRHPTLSFAESIGNVSAGFGTIVLGLFLGPVLLALYDFGYEHLALIHWPKGPGCAGCSPSCSPTSATTGTTGSIIAWPSAGRCTAFTTSPRR